MSHGTPPAAPPGAAPPVVATVWRDGVVESVHRGSVAVAAADGTILAALGDPARATYVRSAAKPFQALAMLELLAGAAVDVDARALAIACASHQGDDLQQIEAARLLALADLDESALRCPPALPAAHASPSELRRDQRLPERLAHNCSGKHAGFLLATVAAGQDPSDYLQAGSLVQRRVRAALAEVTGDEPTGPGVDGCGAPAWVLPLRGLAVAFARLAAGASPALAQVGASMRGHPLLIGGVDCDDSALMLADAGVVAKRGAEAVFAAGWRDPVRGPVGVAVKVEDGGSRAAGPVAAAVLAGGGASVPESVRRPVVLGGGVPHGRLEPATTLASLLQR